VNSGRNQGARSTAEVGGQRLPLRAGRHGATDVSGKEATGRPGLRLVGNKEAAEDLDRRLRTFADRAAHCQFVQGRLARDFLDRRGWTTLGFVRLGDYTRERLGISPRSIEEDARVARALEQLPLLTIALLEGRVNWSAVRLLAGVAEPHDEATWIETTSTLDFDALESLVRSARANKRDLPVAPDAVSESDEDPSIRWSVRVSRNGRRLWNAASELAERVAGEKLSQAQVLEFVAAEAASTRVQGTRAEPGFPGMAGVERFQRERHDRAGLVRAARRRRSFCGRCRSGSYWASATSRRSATAVRARRPAVLRRLRPTARSRECRRRGTPRRPTRGWDSARSRLRYGPRVRDARRCIAASSGASA